MKKGDSFMKMAIIAGAAKALKYKEKNFRASDQEVLRHVTENVDEILEKIEETD